MLMETVEVEFTRLTRRGRERVREIFTGRRTSSLSSDEITASWVAGYEPGADDSLVGRDPRQMTQGEIRAMGHEPMSATAAIRAKCLDCCAGSADEVRKCVAMGCPSWPWRIGTNPWRQPLSDEQREIRRQRALERGFGALRQGVGASLSDESSLDGRWRIRASHAVSTGPAAC
jgi:hypothetical protein